MMKSEATARPLIMRCGAFGDIVLLTALIRQLHARFGQPVDVIASGGWTLPLLTGQPGVGEVHLVRYRRLPHFLVAEQREVVRWLRRRGPGPTWFCDLRVGREVLRHGGIPENYVVDSRDYPWVPGEHFVDRWIRLAQETAPGLQGIAPPPGPRVPSTAVIEIDSAARSKLDAWLQARGIEMPFIVFQMGSRRSKPRWWSRRTGRNKYWPEERWVQVVRAIREQHRDHDILLLGAGREFELNESVQQRAAVPGVYNVADNLPIPILLPLLERAAGMISVDTGPAHAAAALGCPTVSLFGDADPHLYRPGGPHTPAVTLTGTSTDPKRLGQPDIAGISVDRVLDAWRNLHAAMHPPGTEARSSR
jgi:heptosyltransferase-2/heptosyltransferase-3